MGQQKNRRLTAIGWGLSLFLLFLSGCDFAPRYERPCIEIPDCWRVPSSEETTCANLRWWESLGDPILDCLIQQALENNKDLMQAAWRVCEFYAKFQVITSELYPQINSQGLAAKERFPAQTAFLPPNVSRITPIYSYSFNLSFEIDFWGKLRNQSKAGFAELLAQVEDRRTVVLGLVSAVAQSYLQIRELDRELEIAFATREEREEYVHIAILRFEGGLTSEIEVTQAVSALEETEAIITLLEEQIPQQENLLSVLLGEAPTCIVRGRAIDQFGYPPQIPAGLPSELLVRRPDIMAAEARLAAANALIGAARAAFFPTISLTGMFGGDSLELNQLFSKGARAWEIGAQYLQLIFTGGKLTGQLNESIARKQELIYNYEQTILTALQEVNDALIAHEQAKELIVVEERRVGAVEEYLKLAWLRYYDGQTDYLTVLDAERQLFNAEIELTKAQGNLFLTLVDIYKALGGGWVIDADTCLRP